MSQAASLQALPEDRDLIVRLSDCPGVSGAEGPVRNAIWSELKGKVDKGFTDTMGNLFVVAGSGRPGPKVMLSAHMDEVGLMITDIEKEGFLRFTAVGGLDERILPGRAVEIGEKGIPGVIGAKPIHLSSPEDRQKVPKITDLHIDIGATSKENAESLVKVGDRATFATRCEPMGDGLLKGKALDNRVGCALLIRALSMACPFPVWGAFTVQEEVGLRGAQVAAYRIDPDLAIILEGTTCSDTPGTADHLQSTRLGAGPAITVMDASLIPNRILRDALVEAAEQAGVPWQWKGTTYGGTDGGSVHRARAGVPTAVLSIPCRYIHGPAAVMSLADFEAARRTMEVFLREIERVWKRLQEERGISP